MAAFFPFSVTCAYGHRAPGQPSLLSHKLWLQSHYKLLMCLLMLLLSPALVGLEDLRAWQTVPVHGPLLIFLSDLIPSFFITTSLPHQYRISLQCINRCRDTELSKIKFSIIDHTCSLKLLISSHEQF